MPASTFRRGLMFPRVAACRSEAMYPLIASGTRVSRVAINAQSSADDVAIRSNTARTSCTGLETLFRRDSSAPVALMCSSTVNSSVAAATVTRSLASIGTASASPAIVRCRSAETEASQSGDRSGSSASWPGIPDAVATMGLSAAYSSRCPSMRLSTGVGVRVCVGVIAGTLVGGGGDANHAVQSGYLETKESSKAEEACPRSTFAGPSSSSTVTR